MNNMRKRGWSWGGNKTMSYSRLYMYFKLTVLSRGLPCMDTSHRAWDRSDGGDDTLGLFSIVNLNKIRQRYLVTCIVMYW